MKFNPGEQVLVLDTEFRAAGSGIDQVYHPETHTYTILFQYPGTPAPESIPLPEHRLLIHPEIPADHKMTL